MTITEEHLQNTLNDEKQEKKVFVSIGKCADHDYIAVTFTNRINGKVILGDLTAKYYEHKKQLNICKKINVTEQEVEDFKKAFEECYKSGIYGN